MRCVSAAASSLYIYTYATTRTFAAFESAQLSAPANLQNAPKPQALKTLAKSLIKSGTVDLLLQDLNSATPTLTLVLTNVGLR
jgi:hypothetical protein